MHLWIGKKGHNCINTFNNAIQKTPHLAWEGGREKQNQKKAACSDIIFYDIFAYRCPKLACEGESFSRYMSNKTS